MNEHATVNKNGAGIQFGHFDGWVDGKARPADSGERLPVLDPSTGDEVATIARGDASDVDAAVVSAKRAFPAWRDMRPAQRRDALLKLVEVIEANADELAESDIYTAGVTPASAQGAIGMCTSQFKYCAGIIDKIEGASIPSSAGNIDFTMWEPFGVTGHILPWNGPIYLFGRSVAPALAAGNVVIVKPAEQTSLSAIRIAQLASESGALPPGVLNVVPGLGQEAGAALSAHPQVSSMTFTGSINTARGVMKAAADHMAPVVLELGGKTARIIFPDADLDKAVSAIAPGIFSHAGQFCTARSRLFLHESIYDQFLARVMEIAASLKVGLAETGPDVGPVISKRQFDRVMGYIKVGQEEGATLALGGSQVTPPGGAGGYYVEPTIFTDVKNSMRIAQEEIFGPVLCVFKFKDEAEVLAAANDSSYALLAEVWTSDIRRALRLARGLEAARVGINGEELSPQFPSGGYKYSGIGTIKGVEGLKSYMRLKNVSIVM